MSLKLTTKHPNTESTAAYIIATSGTAKEPQQITLLEEKENTVSITTMVSGETARQIYKDVLGGNERDADETIGISPGLRRSARTARPPLPGCGLAVHFQRKDSPSKTIVHPGYGTCGPLVWIPGKDDQGKQVGAIVCAHSCLPVTQLNQKESFPYRMYQPPKEDGGEPKKDEVGLLLKHKPVLFGGESNNMDGALISFGEGEWKDPPLMEHVIWAGSGTLKGNRRFVDTLHIDAMLPKNGLITAEWIKTETQKKVENLSKVTQIFPPQHDLTDLASFYPNGIRIEVVPKRKPKKVWLRVVGSIGRIQGVQDAKKAFEHPEPRWVYMNGRRSGLTQGSFYAINAKLSGFVYDANLDKANFSGLFLVRGRDPKHPFAGPGDSGAPVFIREKNKVSLLGMVLGGVAAKIDKDVELCTLVQPLQPLLDHFKVELVRDNS